RFNDDGTGEWLPLVYGQNGLDASNGFRDQADVLVNTRLAAGLVGATPMDRPEWGAVDPNNGDAYCTRTNNSGRRTAKGAKPATPAVTRRVCRSTPAWPPAWSVPRPWAGLNGVRWTRTTVTSISP